jgi:hypothetical protein
LRLRIETETSSSRSDMTAIDSGTLTRGNKTDQNGSIKWNVHANGAVFWYQQQRAAQYKDVTHLAAFWVTFPLLKHCGRVTQICVFTLQLCRMCDANLRF